MTAPDQNLLALLEGDDVDLMGGALVGGAYKSKGVRHCGFAYPVNTTRCGAYIDGPKPRGYKPVEITKAEAAELSRRTRIVNKLTRGLTQEEYDDFKAAVDQADVDLYDMSDDDFDLFVGRFIPRIIREERQHANLLAQRRREAKKNIVLGTGLTEGERLFAGEGLIGGCGCCGQSLEGRGQYRDCTGYKIVPTERCTSYAVKAKPPRTQAQVAATELLRQRNEQFSRAKELDPDLTRAEFFSKIPHKPRRGMSAMKREMFMAREAGEVF